MDENLLEQIGLTKSEIKVYLALLELGSSSTGKIIDKSKASSSKIYEILDRLIDKGLVSFIVKSGVKYFEPAQPERLMDYMNEKELEINKQKQDLKKIIPELELKRTLSKYKSEATIYRGFKGIQTGFYSSMNLMKPGQEVLAYSIPSMNETLNRFFVNLHKKMVNKKIKRRYILDESAKGELQTLPKNNKFAKIKYLSQQTPSSIIIFNDRVLIFPETKDLLLIAIDSKEVADSFRMQFETLWHQDVRIATGTKGAQDTWNKMLDEMESGEEYYVLGGSWQGQKKEVFDFFIDFQRRRQEKKVKAKFLFVSGTQKKMKSLKDSYYVLSDVRFLPPGTYEGMQINLYHNKVLMFVWRENEPIVFIVEDKTVYKTFKAYFDNLWKQSCKN